ncbi:MAG: TolC family protein [Rickettsiales bacterium]|nr:MAG: TolC family protein [Rickettsiales bacterium]
MNKTFLMLNILVCSSSLSSLTASAINLKQALEAGYENNEEIKNIKNDFLDEIEKFPEALSSFMPRISATANASNNRLKNKSKNVNLNRPATETERFNKSISLEQPIFNGFSSVAALKAAQSSFRASRGDYYAKEQEAFLKEIAVYLDCVTAREKFYISKVSVKSNTTQLEAMQEKLNLGESTETEIAATRERLATAEANQAIAYAEFESAKANFFKTFGVEPMNIEMPEVPNDLPKTLDSLMDIASQSNPLVDGARHKISAAKSGENSAKGDLLPQVSLRIEGGETENKPEQTGAQIINNRSVSTTLSMTVPILSKGGAEYSKIRSAKYKTKKSVINFDNTLKEIQSKCKAYWSEYEASKFRIQASEQAVISAEVAYEGMKQEEILGSKTIIDVLVAEERLYKAREARVDANKGLVISAYKIKSLVGTLTAKTMKLDVKYFEPETEFKKVKLKIVGI